MNSLTPVTGALRISSEGPDLTWVGPNPFTKGLCLGFDDGTIKLSDAATSYTTPHQQISPAKDAINGVAGIGIASLAVSTRSDVTFIQVTTSSQAVFPGGAHTVVATQSGYFVAAIGARGLLVVKPGMGPQQLMQLTEGTEGQLYFYRLVALHDATGREVLVFANRRSGVGFSEFAGEENRRNIHAVAFQGLDVVDVCEVAAGTLSSIAISPKAEVMWIKDSSTREDPVATRLGGIEGPVYRVLATRQHLFVLSSKGLYCWPHLVERMLFDKTSSTKPLAHVVPMEAVDMCLYENEYILLVMAGNAMMSVKIGDLVRQPSAISAANGSAGVTFEMPENTGVEDFAPNWERRDIPQGALASTT